MEPLRASWGSYERAEVRIPRRLWSQMESTLLTERRRESKCFMLCEALELTERVVFLVRELIPLREEDYAQRSSSRVVVRPEFVHALLTRCAKEGLSLLEAHSHPWGGNARFSGIDLASDPEKFKVTAQMSPPFRHGALVFGADMSFEGHFWDYTSQRTAPIERIAVVGVPYTHHYATSHLQPHFGSAPLSLYDRQVRAFGAEGQAVLSQLRVAVVGAGGLGSQVALALTHLGVGEIVLIDPDRLEMSNLNRVVGAQYAQAELRMYKVDALARHLNRVRTPLESPITALPEDARSESALRALLGADSIIGAVDSAVVRQYLNLVAVCGLIPYLDAGVGVRAEGGKLHSGGGQVQTVVPGETACLTCVGHLVTQSVLEQLTPDQRAMSIARGYIQGEAIPNPQVVFLNGVVANLLVWELVKLCTGCHPVEPYVYYDLLAQKAYPASAERVSDCYVCGDSGSLLATGRRGVESFMPKASNTPRNIPAPRSRKCSSKRSKKSKKERVAQSAECLGEEGR